VIRKPRHLTQPPRGPYVPAVPTRQSITLQGMRFHTLVGVLPHEQELPQPLEMDVTVWLSDRLPSGSAGSLDYRELYLAMADAVARSPIGYLEDLVDRAAQAALALSAVARVRVAARKPHVALPGPLAYAEVAIERDRHD
jgi:7,8-dihydroneopterin aldolase/epimerase/oxygenase